MTDSEKYTVLSYLRGTTDRPKFLFNITRMQAGFHAWRVKFVRHNSEAIAVFKDSDYDNDPLQSLDAAIQNRDTKFSGIQDKAVGGTPSSTGVRNLVKKNIKRGKYTYNVIAHTVAPRWYIIVSDKLPEKDAMKKALDRLHSEK